MGDKKGLKLYWMGYDILPITPYIQQVLWSFEYRNLFCLNPNTYPLISVDRLVSPSASQVLAKSSGSDTFSQWYLDVFGRISQISTLFESLQKCSSISLPGACGISIECLSNGFIPNDLLANFLEKDEYKQGSILGYDIADAYLTSILFNWRLGLHSYQFMLEELFLHQDECQKEAAKFRRWLKAPLNQFGLIQDLETAELFKRKISKTVKPTMHYPCFIFCIRLIGGYQIPQRIFGPYLRPEMIEAGKEKVDFFMN